MGASEKKMEAPNLAVPNAAAGGALRLVDEPVPSRGSSRRRRALGDFLVVLLAAGIAASTGCRSQPPVRQSSEVLYQSRKTIYIEPRIPTPQESDGRGVFPMFHAFVAAQVELLQSRRTTLLAMQMPAWQRVRGDTSPGAIERFEAGRYIVHEPGTQHIEILFRDHRPEVAAGGVRALTEAYQKLSAEQGDSGKRLEDTRSAIKSLRARMRLASNEIASLTKDYGGVEGLQLRLLQSVEEALEAQKDLAEVRRQLRMHEAMGELSPEEIALESPQMAQYLLNLDKLIARCKVLEQKKTTDQDDLYLQLEREIRLLRKGIEKLVVAWSRRRAAEAEELRIRQKALEERTAHLRDETRKMGSILDKVMRLQAERERMSLQLDQMKALREELEARVHVSGEC